MIIKKEYLIIYKTRLIGKFKRIYYDSNWSDYSGFYNTLPYLKKELKYLLSVGYQAKIIERTTITKDKEIS